MPERNFEILPYDTAVRLPSRRKRPRWSSNAPSLNVRGIECAPPLVGVLYGAMCGRYVTKDQAAIERAFSIVKLGGVSKRATTSRRRSRSPWFAAPKATEKA